MKYSTDDIKEFLYSHGIKRRSLTEHTTLVADLGITGDDLEELLIDYAEIFEVDMSSFLWYFHSKGEGVGSIGALFFKPPNKRVEHIPITIDLMTSSANMGAWSVKYPEHKLPKHRLDTFIDQLLFGGFLVYLIISSIKGCA